MSPTLGAVLRQATCALTQAGVAEPRADAEVLLADALATTRTRLYVEAASTLSVAQQEAYGARLQRRLHGEPVQYITGKQEFWSLDFTVTPQVLIPRPDSEGLVEQGARLAQSWQAAHPEALLCVLDVGTGSGNLALSLASMLPQAQVWALDQSLGALHVARHNARSLGLVARVHWVCSDLLTAFRVPQPVFAVCVANLPYVTTAEWQQLPPEIRQHEPRTALCGGSDGLACIRRLITQIPPLLAPGGTVLLEVGWQQAPAVLQLLQQPGQFVSAGVYYDLAGIARIVWGQVGPHSTAV